MAKFAFYGDGSPPSGIKEDLLMLEYLTEQMRNAALCILISPPEVSPWRSIHVHRWSCLWLQNARHRGYV